MFVWVYGVSGALSEVRPTQALLTAIQPMLSAVRDHARGDSVVVGSNPFQKNLWHASLSFRFSQLAHANRLQWPPTRSELCEDAARLAKDDPRTLVVRVSTFCPPMGTPLQSIDVPYVIFNWDSKEIETRRVQLEIFRGGHQQ